MKRKELNGIIKAVEARIASLEELVKQLRKQKPVRFEARKMSDDSIWMPRIANEKKDKTGLPKHLSTRFHKTKPKKK